MACEPCARNEMCMLLLLMLSVSHDAQNACGRVRCVLYHRLFRCEELEENNAVFTSGEARFPSSFLKNKKRVVLGSPHLDLRTGGVVSYISQRTTGAMYGCGDMCVDIHVCPMCTWSYTDDIFNHLKTKKKQIVCPLLDSRA